MGWILFADETAAGQIEKLDSGAIRVRGRIARTGVQAYAPWAGAPVQDRPIKIYRPPEQVFSDASLKSLKGTPVTVGHPPDRCVTADNWKKFAVGHNEGDHRRVSSEGADFVESSIVVSDGEAIKALLSKDLVEISQGYTVELDWRAGVTDSGEAYDGIQTQITHNHTALLGVGDARAGGGARVLLDSNQGEKYMDKKAFAALLEDKLKKVDSKQHTKIKKLATDAFEASLTDMSEEKLRAAVEAFVTAVTAPDEEEAPPEEEAPTDEEEAPPEEKEEEEKKKLGDSKDLAAGKALVKQIADSQSQTLSVIDTRESVRGMVADGYDFAGKSVRDLQLDAIAAVNPEVRKALGDKASDEKIAGAFETLRASRSSWIKTDSKPVRKGEHVERYTKRMSDAFDKSWEGK